MDSVKQDSSHTFTFQQLICPSFQRAAQFGAPCLTKFLHSNVQNMTAPAFLLHWNQHCLALEMKPFITGFASKEAEDDSDPHTNAMSADEQWSMAVDESLCLNQHIIQRRNSRFFTISSLRRELSPTPMLNWLGYNHVQITCNTSSTYHVQHVMLRATWYKGTAQLLSLTELKSHLFELYFIGWTINRWRRGGNWTSRRKPLATSFRKCHILKPKDSSPKRHSNPYNSIGSRLGKQTC